MIHKSMTPVQGHACCIGGIDLEPQDLEDGVVGGPLDGGLQQGGAQAQASPFLQHAHAHHGGMGHDGPRTASQVDIADNAPVMFGDQEQGIGLVQKGSDPDFLLLHGRMEFGRQHGDIRTVGNVSGYGVDQFGGVADGGETNGDDRTIF